jgi:hypothetical protein
VTDEGKWHADVSKDFLKHETVNPGDKEWKRDIASTNTARGYFGVFKRGMKGVHQHCAERHLHRYLAECDFVKLGVDDAVRADRTLMGVVGKRLTYQTTAQG